MRTPWGLAAATVAVVLLSGCMGPAETESIHDLPSSTPEAPAAYLGSDLTFAAGADAPVEQIGFDVRLADYGYPYAGTLDYGSAYQNVEQHCAFLVADGYAPTEVVDAATGDEDGSVLAVQYWYPGVDVSTIGNATFPWGDGHSIDFKTVTYTHPDNNNTQIYFARYLKNVGQVIALMVDCGPDNTVHAQDVVDILFEAVTVRPGATDYGE